jgi:hypothetical protein
MAAGEGQTTHKFVVVLNKKIEPGVALNAAAHMAACLAGQASEEDRENMMFVNYKDADEGIHPVSALSLIVLRARNSNQIRRARNDAAQQGVLFVDFLESMTKDTYVEQMERTGQLKEEELEYWGLCLFGPKEVLDTITGKFSMWR